MLKSYFQTREQDFTLYKGDSRALVSQLPIRPVDMVFADPPYFLSNDGFSVHAGKCVSVNKGGWDRSRGMAFDTGFTFEWIKACRDRMADSATIWVCGTVHNLFAVGTVLSELNFRILNAITWQKTNPPPNLSCRFFTHSTEVIVWARKQKRVPHTFNYDLMHFLAGDRQMSDVWRMPAVLKWEKSCGKHPAQKPLAVVVRAILASSKEGDLIFDPFAGSATTGIAANLVNRNFVGVEQDSTYLEMAKMRRLAFDSQAAEWADRIPDLKRLKSFSIGKSGL